MGACPSGTCSTWEWGLRRGAERRAPLGQPLPGHSRGPAAGALLGHMLSPLIMRTTGACFALINLASTNGVLFGPDSPCSAGRRRVRHGAFFKPCWPGTSQTIVVLGFCLRVPLGVVLLVKRIRQPPRHTSGPSRKTIPAAAFWATTPRATYGVLRAVHHPFGPGRSWSFLNTPSSPLLHRPLPAA